MEQFLDAGEPLLDAEEVLLDKQSNRHTTLRALLFESSFSVRLRRGPCVYVSVSPSFSLLLSLPPVSGSITSLSLSPHVRLCL